MSAYYNEHDKYAAAWLRELIVAGHIADGEVDERDIQEVKAKDLQGFTQCHFFAGIGVWSYALRGAGWTDDEPVWTGSCPCQPFSSAGKRMGTDDIRHLWPEWWRLIEEFRPDTIFGEQVASPDGLTWLDIVQADLEGAGYAVGTADLCAAGFGAPHIRQRLYFVADSSKRGTRKLSKGRRAEGKGTAHPNGGREVGSVDNATGRRREQRDAEQRAIQESDTGCSASELVNAEVGRGRPLDGESSARRKPQVEAGGRSVLGELGNSERERLQGHSGDGLDGDKPGRVGEKTPGPVAPPGILNGFWADAEWIWCRDGKWRPVEPGTFPLAHGAPARVGRLRGYGNAINAEQAIGFIRACREVRGC